LELVMEQARDDFLATHPVQEKQQSSPMWPYLVHCTR
jgi:hypothetical protein